MRRRIYGLEVEYAVPTAVLEPRVHRGSIPGPPGATGTAWLHPTPRPALAAPGDVRVGAPRNRVLQGHGERQERQERQLSRGFSRPSGGRCTPGVRGHPVTLGPSRSGLSEGRFPGMITGDAQVRGQVDL